MMFCCPLQSLPGLCLGGQDPSWLAGKGHLFFQRETLLWQGSFHLLFLPGPVITICSLSDYLKRASVFKIKL